MDKLDYLLSPRAVRERSHQIFERCLNGEGEFSYHPERWDEVLNYVDDVIKENYPDFNIPFHSRLNHFSPDGVNRIDTVINGLVGEEKTKALIDLVIVSVLLDAGAGDQWRYHERESNKTFSRSEGLGIASFHLFKSELLSGGKGLQVTKEGLEKLSLEDFLKSFQVSEDNPLLGDRGRFELLKKCAQAIQERPSEIFEACFVASNTVCALKVLTTLLKKFSTLWPGQYSWEGISLGDTWYHPAIVAKEDGDPDFSGLIPFHKLSQWMSYSLLDCFRLGGHEILNLEHLTGLPEYRNGGLMIDLGLLRLKKEEAIHQSHSVDSPLIVEWRALTICLLDELALRLRERHPQVDLPMVKVLEGGPWWAGRKIARVLRPETGGSPIKIMSDGNVF